VALELQAELARLQAEVGDEPHAAADAELTRLLSSPG